MAEKNIPDEHHVIRHCPKARTIRENGVVVGVQPSLFHLRSERHEKYLSMSYWEFFDGDDPARVKFCHDNMPLTMRKGDALVKLNASTVREIGSDCGQKLRVVHKDDNRKNPAYAKITGVPSDVTSPLFVKLASAATSIICAVI